MRMVKTLTASTTTQRRSTPTACIRGSHTFPACHSPNLGIEVYDLGCPTTLSVANFPKKWQKNKIPHRFGWWTNPPNPQSPYLKMGGDICFDETHKCTTPNGFVQQSLTHCWNFNTFHSRELWLFLLLFWKHVNFACKIQTTIGFMAQFIIEILIMSLSSPKLLIG